MKADIDEIPDTMSRANRRASASTRQVPMGGGTTHGPMTRLLHAADAMFNVQRPWLDIIADQEGEEEWCSLGHTFKERHPQDTKERDECPSKA